jgi:hypothetical protein
LDEEEMKQLRVVLVGLLLLDVGLCGWYLLLDERGNQPNTLQAVPTPAPPLIDRLVAGVQEKEVDGEPIAELIGWVEHVDLEGHTLVVGQPETPLRSEVFFDDSCVIRKAVETGGMLSHEDKTSADLIPQHTRVSILCQDPSCQKASVITIIEER